MFHDGSWGTVCDDQWTLMEANVVCRQLGLDQAFSAVQGGVFGEGSGKIWMDQVKCFGDERRLSDCSFPGWERHNCKHSEDAGVICMLGNKKYAVYKKFVFVLPFCLFFLYLIVLFCFVLFFFYTNIRIDDCLD